MIERIQTITPVYQQASAERIEAQIKKTATADAVSFDEERSQQERPQQEKKEEKQEPEAIATEAPIVASAKAEPAAGHLDIRV